MSPPTSEALRDDAHRPYLLWWLDANVGDLKRNLASPDLETRACWLGALRREANSRDVWLFVTRDDIAALWPLLTRHLGRTRERWAWQLDLPLLPGRLRRRMRETFDSRVVSSRVLSRRCWCRDRLRRVAQG